MGSNVEEELEALFKWLGRKYSRTTKFKWLTLKASKDGSASTHMANIDYRYLTTTMTDSNDQVENEFHYTPKQQNKGRLESNDVLDECGELSLTSRPVLTASNLVVSNLSCMFCSRS